MESSKRITDVWLSIWTTTNTTTSMGLNKTTNTTQVSAPRPNNVTPGFNQYTVSN